MKTRKHDTHWMVGVALMAAIVVVLANTPLGMLPVGPINASLLTIPVAIGAMLLGPAAGALLGAIFLLWADVLCRVLLPGKELPIGVLTSLVGAPVFIYLMARRRYGFGGGD